jgi:hypothetical protein
MLSLLLASAVAAAGPQPDAGAGAAAPPPSAEAAAAPAPTPAPTAASPAAPPAAPTTPTPTPAPTIDSILKSGANQSTDTEEEPSASAPATGPVPYSELDSKAYDDAVRHGAAEGRTLAGTLDGGWTLAASDGQRLYRFQFVGHGPMEPADGAWRDLAGGPGLQGSGFVELVGYTGDRLLLRFFEASAGGQVEVSVKPSGSGPWSGELKRGTTVTQVTLKKD